MKLRHTALLRITTLLGIFLYCYGYAFSGSLQGEVLAEHNRPGSYDYAPSRNLQDTLVVERMFSYRRNFTTTASGSTGNAYIKCNLRTLKRNPTLFLVPSMYYIAKGRRNYVGEVYGQITYNSVGDYGMKRQVFVNTIPHNSEAMSTVIQYISPNLYGISLYKDILLSPFHRGNKIFYRYRISPSPNGRSCITFTPRQTNTQLVSGFAIVENSTGRIVNCQLNGEHDMIKFDVDVDMGEKPEGGGRLPVSCKVMAQFKFAGNDIRANILAVYNCTTTLPDSISNVCSPEIMDSIRPVALNNIEREAYRQYQESQNAATDTVSAPTGRTIGKASRATLDALGNYLVNSSNVQSSNVSLSVSPLINPSYLSYSRSRGMAYRLKLGAQYLFSSERNISLSPDLGYNFKIKQFFINATLRYTYNSSKRRWVELTFANGNRITDSGVLDIIKSEHMDTINFDALGLNYFKDNMLKAAWNTTIGKPININLGAVFHRRKAVNPEPMTLAGKPSAYYSFAPFLTVTYIPFHYGPVFTGNYERGVRHIMHSNTEYERWEFDASFSKSLPRMRRYSVRFGGGFYTNKKSVFFVDFSNFHENYLPGGWDDDWTGDFQLLNSQWYNASRFYLRTNASYESPFLLLTWMPILGRYIETERLYLSSLQIQHTRPYFELGYGFTTRYFSVGLFGSFLNGSFHEFGSKFTIELFSRW